jgi:hypothetical protein
MDWAQGTLIKYNKQVVLIADTHISPRMCKIGWALRSAGFRVILLHHCNAHKYILETSDFFDETHVFASSNQALEIARGFAPLVYHIFSSWNFDLAELFITAKPGKIVFDDSDIISGIVKTDFADKNYPNLMSRERFCLENADGLVGRSLEIQHVKKKLHFTLKGKTILFLDYCWDYPLNEYLGKKEEGLHLVYAGSVYVEKHFPPGTKNDTFFSAFSSEITSAQIHFHMYPNPVQSNDFRNYFADYFELAEVNPFFHIHYPVPSNQLGPELSKYDIALVTAEKEHVEQGNEAYHPVKNRLSMPHKVFDYIDAGLGIIIAEGFEFPWRVLKRRGVGVGAYLENVKEKIVSTPRGVWMKLKKNARTTKSSYSVKAQIPRLISFYYSLYESAQPETKISDEKGHYLLRAYALFKDGNISASIIEANKELRLYPDNEEAVKFIKVLRITALKS